MARIPEFVRQFIAKHIHSIDVLDILLLLRQESRKEWRALEVSKTLRLERTSTEARLEQLLAAGLVTIRYVEAERVYRYDPSTGEIADTVNELARWYSSHRVALYRWFFLILQKGFTRIRRFSKDTRTSTNN